MKVAFFFLFHVPPAVVKTGGGKGDRRGGGFGHLGWCIVNSGPARGVWYVVTFAWILFDLGEQLAILGPERGRRGAAWDLVWSIWDVGILVKKVTSPRCFFSSQANWRPYP